MSPWHSLVSLRSLRGRIARQLRGYRLTDHLVLAHNRNRLPALSFPFKDGSGNLQKNLIIGPIAGAPPTPLISPKTTMYSGQSLPYAYPTPTTSAGPSQSTQSGYFPSSEPHRAIEEKEERQCPVQPQRQSLPSIHEALGTENPLPLYSGPPTSGPPSQPTHQAPPPSLASNLVRPNGDGPPGPPNPFSNAPSTGSLLRDSSFSQPGQLPADAPRSSLASVSSQGSRNASLNSLSSGKSSTRSATTGITSVAGSQTGYEYGARTSASSAASTGGHGPFSQSFSFQPQQAPTYPLAPYDSRSYAGGPWKPGAAAEPARLVEVKGEVVGHPGIAGQLHGDSAKRQLDVHDVETSLNEVGLGFLLFSFFFFLFA